MSPVTLAQVRMVCFAARYGGPGVDNLPTIRVAYRGTERTTADAIVRRGLATTHNGNGDLFLTLTQAGVDLAKQYPVP